MCCVGGERGTGSISTVKEMEKEEEEVLQDLLDDSGLDSGFRYRYKQNTSDHCFSKPCTLYSDPDPTFFIAIPYRIESLLLENIWMEVIQK